MQSILHGGCCFLWISESAAGCCAGSNQFEETGAGLDAAAGGIWKAEVDPEAGALDIL